MNKIHRIFVKFILFIISKAARRVVSTNSGIDGKQSFSLLSSSAQATANKELLDHRRKRMIEAKVFEFTESLLEKGVSLENAQRQADRLRVDLLNEDKDDDNDVNGARDNKINAHITRDNKRSQDKKLRNIFRIDDDFVEGSSFDPTAIDNKKKQRALEWQSSHNVKEEEEEDELTVKHSRSDNNDDDGKIKRFRVEEEEGEVIMPQVPVPLPSVPPEPVKTTSRRRKSSRRSRPDSLSSSGSSSSSSRSSSRSSRRSRRSRRGK